jgi:dolichyl-phosphate mannosyltransferase polypeptide 2 regulatory subunit
MLIVATTVFAYYTVWAILMVWNIGFGSCALLTTTQPFVDEEHPLHSLFPPRVWAIRIPVILILLGSAVVGSFLSVVMIRSNRKKALKAKQAKKA